MSNKTKVWLFLITLSLLLLVIGFQIYGRLGLFIGFISAILLNTLVFYFGENHLLKTLSAQQLSGRDPWHLNEAVRELADKLGIKKPKLFLFSTDSVCALSLGHSHLTGSICVSTGLIENLSAEEIKAVLAYEVCHLQHGNKFIFGVTSTLVHSLVGFAQFLDSFFPLNSRKINFAFNKPALTLFSPLAWLLIRLSVSKNSILKIDSLAGQLIADNRKLASALWKIENYCKTMPLQIPPYSSHLFIVNPQSLSQKNWFYISHPQISQRVSRLIGYYPI